MSTASLAHDTLEKIPLQLEWRDGSHAGMACFDEDGTLHLHGEMTVEHAAFVFLDGWRSPLYVSPFILRALCGHYPADEQTALFWETVRAMLREDETFGVRAE